MQRLLHNSCFGFSFFKVENKEKPPMQEAMKGSHHVHVPIQSECSVHLTTPASAVVFKVKNKGKPPM
jgi:hypothetical protein